MDLLIIGFISTTSVIRFGTGQEIWAAQHLQGVQLLDLDSFSERVFAVQISSAIKESDRVALWLVSSEPEANFGAISPVLEAWIHCQSSKLLLLHGNHLHVNRIGEKHAEKFVKSESVEVLRDKVKVFFSSSGKGN